MRAQFTTAPTFTSRLRVEGGQKSPKAISGRQWRADTRPQVVARRVNGVNLGLRDFIARGRVVVV